LVKKRILFLNTVYSHPAIDEALDQKDIVVIAFSVEACVELQRRKIKFHYADDLYDPDRWERMEALARKYPEDWDKAIRKDLDYRGVPVGMVFSRELSEYFRDMLKSNHVAEAALARFSPDEVICSPPIPFGSWAAVDSAPIFVHLPSILRSVCEAKGVAFRYLDGVENRQVFEVQREDRKLFDMAVKGRNSLKEILRKMSTGSKKKDIRVLSVLLKQGMFDAIQSYGRSNGVEVIRYFPAGDVFKVSDPSDLGPALARMKDSWAKLNDDDKLLPALPAELAPLREACKEDIECYLKHAARRIMREVAFLETTLERLEIDLLLCLEDWNPMGKARVAKAEAMDIPSVVIQHGIFAREFHIQYSYPRGRYNFVWGPAYIDPYLSDGFPRENIFETGLTTIDVIFSRPKDGADVDDFMRSIGVPDGKKRILWTNSPIHIAYLSVSQKKYLAEIRGVFEMMRDRKETLIVKPHQIESPAIYKAIAREVDYEPIIMTRDLPKLIYGSDVVIINNSTVGLQALIAGKPLVLFTTQAEGDILSYAKEGVAAPAFTLEDLPKALDKVLYADKGKGVDKTTLNRYFNQYAPKPDGGGMTTVVDHIIKILKKKDGKKGSKK